jgi:hypothetical protein
MLDCLREQQDAFGVSAPNAADCHARRYVSSADGQGHGRSVRTSTSRAKCLSRSVPAVNALSHGWRTATTMTSPATAKTTEISGSPK